MVEKPEDRPKIAPARQAGFLATVSHPLLALGALMVTVFVSAFALMGWIEAKESAIRAGVQRDLEASFAEKARIAARDMVEEMRKAGTLAPVQATLETVFTTPPQGTENIDVSLLSSAIAQGRDIYISYTRAEAGVEHRWLRRCDHTVIDNVTNAQPAVSCFILRVPDTDFKPNTKAREITDPMMFEDHQIFSDGRYVVRKYRVEAGQIEVVPMANGDEPYRQVKWQAVRLRGTE